MKRSRCLVKSADVEAAIARMAGLITAQLRKRNPLFLCVMNGALIFTGKLLTHLDFPLQMDYIHATRYRGETRGGELEFKAYPAISLHQRVVVVLDDILDEGFTLAALKNWCREQGATEVYSAVLVNKVHDRKNQDLTADFVGLEIADHYLFGYGMDYREYLRNAAGIYAVDACDE